MAEIFLSYANEDRATALRVSRLLESAGWSVWWDRRIPAGRTWRSMIEEALGRMRCMVVLWSSHSIHSDWVKEEAEEAREIGKLVPVLIESVKPPVGFRAIQAADLTGWDGSSDSPGAQQLITDLKALIGTPAQTDKPGAPEVATVQSEPAAEQLQTSPGPDAVHTSSGYQAGSAQEHGLDQKRIIAISGALALLVMLGGFLFWFKNPQNEPDRTSAAAVAEPSEEAKEPAAPELVNLSIEGGQPKLNPKEGFTLRMRGKYSDGNEKQLDSGIDWSSSNPKVAAIDGNGTVSALQSGSTAITGRYNGMSASPLNLTVAEAPVAKAEATLVAIRIQRTRKELTANETIPLRVRGNYSDGSEKAVPSKIEWQTSDPKIAAVNSRGELRALQPGETDVVASVGGIKSSPLHLVVRRPVQQQVETEASAQKTYGTSVATPTPRPPVSLGPYLNRAKDYRIQGNYTAALAELEKARALDDANAEVRKEIDQTRRACNAEKRLGRYDLQC